MLRLLNSPRRRVAAKFAALCAVLMAALGGCSIGPETSQPLLPEGDWVLQRWVIDGEPQPLDAGIKHPTLTVQSDGAISGSASVNRYNGEAEFASHGRLTISPRIMTTRRAGPPAAMQQERQFLSLLPAITRYQLQSSTLRLENAESWLEFDRIQ